MTTILWTQNESTDIKPTILVDGCHCESEELLQAAFNKLCEAHDCLRITPEDSNDLLEKCKDKCEISRQLNYAILKKDKDIYIQGCYHNKDVRGRVLPYMFRVSGKISFEAAIELLRDQSRILNRTLNEMEVKILQLHNKKRQRRFGLK